MTGGERGWWSTRARLTRPPSRPDASLVPPISLSLSLPLLPRSLCLFSCPSTYLPPSRPIYLPNYLPTYLPTYLSVYLPTCLPTNLPTHLPTATPTQYTRLHQPSRPDASLIPPLSFARTCVYIRVRTQVSTHVRTHVRTHALTHVRVLCQRARLRGWTPPWSHPFPTYLQGYLVYKEMPNPLGPP